jgi:hypothetical protein
MPSNSILTHVNIPILLPFYYWRKHASFLLASQWKLAHTPYGKWVTINDRIDVTIVDEDDAVSSEESLSEDEQEYQSKDNSSVVSDSSTASSDRRGTWAQYTLRHLASSAHYRFRVRCRNMIGWSYVSSESAKFVTGAATDMTSRRGGGGLQAANKGHVKCEPHASARFNMLQRMRLDCINKCDHVAKAKQEHALNASRTLALIRIQNWYRSVAGRRMYLRFKTEKVAQMYVLVEYDMIGQFDAGWRAKLLLNTVRARAQEEARQEWRDERRKRKLARRERRERHQLKRRLRRVQRQKQKKEQLKLEQ